MSEREPPKLPSTMTDESMQYWAQLKPEWQIQRLKDWALMLERRLAELDPNYRAYSFGRTVIEEKT
jgi:hypothetical protein